MTPEEEARQQIDRQLSQCGWLVQDAREMNISAGPGVAIREFPLTTGEADYLLYVNQRAAGVMEAKPEGYPLTGVEAQSAKYTKGLPAGLPHCHLPLPFAHESTGTETRFTNLLDPYRAAMLKAAVEGKLTAQWRAKHVDAASCRVLEGSRESVPTRQDAASTEENPAGDGTFPLVGYFDPLEPVANLQGNLPHWRQEGATYFVTFRLADSIPPQKLDLWQRERDDWLRRHPPPHSNRQREEYSRLFVHRFHQWLDAGYGRCVLAQPAVRKIAVDALRCFEKDRYLLREWVVMPNHVHAVLTPLPGYELSSVIHSWKSYTANEINKHLGRKGTLWQKEAFDHIVRGPDELDRIERYIHDNPGLLPADRFTLHCLHEPAPPVEAASCRFPDGAPTILLVHPLRRRRRRTS